MNRTGSDPSLRATDPADLVARDRAVLWHPYAAMPASLPAVPVVAAVGNHLELADGRRVVDGMASWWAAIHGYRHPVLDEAVRAQLTSMAHVMFGGITHAPAVELAELLVAISGPGLDHVFLADSGSVAVEVAIKMALQHARGRGRPERSRLLAVRGGYHGDTLGCMAVGDPVTGMHAMFADVLPRQYFAPRPEPAFGEPFDEAVHLRELVEILDRHQDEIAAVILEPVVQGAGGMWFYSPDYLVELRRRCDDAGVLLIADEIATGFGRTGELFGCDHAGVVPDIACVGKALTGGYLSMAAVLCTAEVAEGVSRAESGALMHGPTFMGNPLAAAVSRASVQLLLDRPWRDEVAAIAHRLEVGLAPLRGGDGVLDVRVLGAIGVVELARELDMATSQAILLDHGVWLRPFGRLLYTMPPYGCDDVEVAAITEAMRAVVAAEAGRDGT